MTNYNTTNFYRQAGSGRDNEAVFTGPVEFSGQIVSSNVLQEFTTTLTLSEINQGKTIFSGIAGKTITVKDFIVIVSGTFATGTSLELEQTFAIPSPLLVFSTAVATLTNGARIVPNDATQLGGGFLGPMPTGAGLAITKTGSDFTGGTSIKLSVQYTLT